MLLDLRTIYVVDAVACLLLGIVQLLAFATGRFERWPLLWGLSNLLLGIGTLAVAMQTLVPDVIGVDLANIVTLVGYLLLLAAVRMFAGKPMHVRWYGLALAAGVVPLVLFFHDAASYANRVAFLSLYLCFCDLAVAREGVRLALREKLASAWILVGLFVPTALIFAARSLLAVTGRLDAGGGLFVHDGSVHAWIGMTASAFICLRGITLVMMASERMRNKLIELAQTDPLTGALNRAGLTAVFSRLPRAMPVCALLIDVDHFKALNDTYGHAIGDRVLQLLVAAAQAHIRPNDIVVRQGGDEFVVVIPKAGLAAAVIIAERIRSAFLASTQAEIGAHVAPTLSIGAAEGVVGIDSLAALLQRADEAAYCSKRGGRDRIEVFSDGRQAA